MGWKIETGNVLDWAKRYDGPPFHALLCDPPYHLTSITKRFGSPNSAAARAAPYRRVSRGFMGQTWDGGDLAFQPETWSTISRVLHPGAFGLVFASAKGWHRVAIALEDAGMIIHPNIFLLGWLNGHGFPKATRIDRQIDRHNGKSGRIVGFRRHSRGGGTVYNLRTCKETCEVFYYPTIEPQTDLAKTWRNHRYGGQILKPALEPIIVFQKPYAGKPLDSITATGAGALNIEAARIPHGKPCRPMKAQSSGHDFYRQAGRYTDALELKPEGRWPANVALVHHPDCMPGDCTIDCPVASCLDNRMRYFENVYYTLENETPFLYMPKASTKEREAGLDGLAETTINDGGPTPIDNSYQRGKTRRHNDHPTVKPLGLTRWLATLLLPPAEYAPRRLFVPFSGSGSEMIGGLLAGWDEVVGVELLPAYIMIAERRLHHWSTRNPSPRQKTDRPPENRPGEQLALPINFGDE